MLRSIFVIALASFGLYKGLRAPIYALAFYLWIAYFRPESWLWYDFVSALNLSFIAGLLVVGSSMMRGASFRSDIRTIALFGLLAQGLLSTLLSEHLDYCLPYWIELAKSAVIAYLIACLVDDTKKLRLIFIVIVCSLGFEFAKQGWAQLVLNPGAKNANTHPLLGDENGVGLGVLMLVPLISALVETSASKWHRRLGGFLIIGVVYRAISTYSRGAFISSGILAALGFFYSRKKLRAALAVVVIGGAVLPVLPDAFWARMDTIAFSEDQLREDDNSSRGRLHFWRVAVQMANDRPLVGVGVNGFHPAYDQYDFLDGRYGRRRAVHSSWFGPLAELGYIGFALYLLNLGLALWACRSVRRAIAAGTAAPELAPYAVAIENTLIVFMVGGSFLSFHYVEMLWHIIGLSAALLGIARQPMAVAVSAPAAARAPMPELAHPRLAFEPARVSLAFRPQELNRRAKSGR